MSKSDGHSRRDFLQGRAAVRAAADQAQAWLDSTSELLGAQLATGPVAHVHASRRAMACEFAVQFHQADTELQVEVLAAFDLIERIEDQLTIYRDESEVLEINQLAAREPVVVDCDLFALLQVCQDLHRETSGAFDITSGPLSRAWGFLQRAGRVPEASELDEALAHVGGEKVVLDEAAQTVEFSEAGVEINFNSIGKGYALDCVAQQLDKSEHSDFLWHGGGSSVLARGENRSSPDACWSVGLRHPLHPETRLTEFYLRDRALATAGGASQFFECEGQSYSHILDPRTGWPAEGVLTATVLAPSAAWADGLATALFVLGVEAAKDYCSLHSEVAALVVCPAAEPPGITLHAFGLSETDWSPPASASGC